MKRKELPNELMKLLGDARNFNFDNETGLVTLNEQTDKSVKQIQAWWIQKCTSSGNKYNKSYILQQKVNVLKNMSDRFYWLLYVKIMQYYGIYEEDKEFVRVKGWSETTPNEAAIKAVLNIKTIVY